MTTRSLLLLPKHALCLQLDLQKTRFIGNNLKRACAKSLLLHLLYSRGVLPCPVGELLISSESDHSETISLEYENSETGKAINNLETVSRNEKKRNCHVTRMQRIMKKHSLKIQQFLNDFDDLFTCIGNATTVDDASIKAVLFTLGPSFTSPREQYLIRFIPPSSSQQEQHVNDKNVDLIEVIHNNNNNNNIKSDDENNNKNNTTWNTIKGEQEIARRTIRLFLQGTCASTFIEDDTSKEKAKVEVSKRNLVDIFDLSRKLCRKSFSSRKMNVAFYISPQACTELFESIATFPSSSLSTTTERSKHTYIYNDALNHDENDDDNEIRRNNIVNHQSSNIFSTGTTNHQLPSKSCFQVRHTFQVKIPTMISKKKNIHRPFVSMDIVPASSSLNNNNLDDIGEGQWITLTKSIKSFRL